jgi:hypothetical protein
MYALLRRYFTLGATVDVGCGSGRDVAWLRVNGYDAPGFDASEGLVREARLACPEACFGIARLPDLEGVPRAAYANVIPLVAGSSPVGHPTSASRPLPSQVAATQPPASKPALAAAMVRTTASNSRRPQRNDSSASSADMRSAAKVESGKCMARP